MLKIYNTLTQKKEIFKSLVDKKINMYVCGMTVYDYCHLGHARVMLVFDVVVRYLRSQGFEVNYVCNITDIDDKIIQRAHENKETFQELTQRYIQALEEDMKALGVISPTKQPRATSYIAEMQALISVLLEEEIAYRAVSGDIYYDVKKFPSYGKLSHRHLDELQAGIRVEVSEDKKNPLDFVLWKMAKPGEPAWDSPWGRGRPGWHIECSAMSMQCLGEHFDIHGGGFDLIFPHHENEIAQSEGVTHKTFANTWMHVGYLQVNKEKMSKSLGNFFTIRDILKKYHPEVIRYFILSSQYRSPLHYSEEILNNAQLALERLYLVLREFNLKENIKPASSRFRERFLSSMNDDFNTPEALAVLFEIAREINRIKNENEEEAKMLAYELREEAAILGLLTEEPSNFLQKSSKEIDVKRIEMLIQQRVLARLEKDWKQADKIRDELFALGVVIEDAEGKTRWRIQ